jgi:hypothetical protein
MSFQNLTEEQMVQKCTLDVLTHPKYRSLAGVIMMGSTRVEDDPKKCPTAYTNGVDKIYGRAFIRSLIEQEVRFLVLHECMHVALRHLITWLWMWKDDPMLANQACDYVINILLVLSDDNEGFIKMPAKGWFDLRFKGMDSGEVFRLLKEEKKDGKPEEKKDSDAQAAKPEGEGEAQAAAPTAEEEKKKKLMQLLNSLDPGDTNLQLQQALEKMPETYIEKEW